MAEPTEEALRWVVMRLRTEAALDAARIGAIRRKASETEPASAVEEWRTVTQGRRANVATTG